jgi:hypothetical protein
VILYENPFNFWKTLLEREGNQKLSLFSFVVWNENKKSLTTILTAINAVFLMEYAQVSGNGGHLENSRW